jgi:hypothetical protein
MQNGKVEEGDVFSQQKHLYCLSYIQNFVTSYITLHHIKDSYALVQKFNNVPRVTAIVFHKITSVSKIVLIGDGAKGLRLDKSRGTRSCSIRTDIFMKEKKRGKIKTILSKISGKFQAKSRRSLGRDKLL